MDQGSNSLIATEAEGKSVRSDQISTASQKCKDRRSIKLQYKSINRICLEMDVARSKKKPIAGISEHQKVIGNFSIIMFDLQSEFLYQLKEDDQDAIRAQIRKQALSSQNDLFDGNTKTRSATQASYGDNNVDCIRFLKTNGAFYERAITLWLKFLQVNKLRLHQASIEK